MIAVLESCDLAPSKNKFVISSIERTDGTLATYHLKGVDGISNSLWFTDSIKNFKVGDTLYLSLKR